MRRGDCEYFSNEVGANWNRRENAVSWKSGERSLKYKKNIVHRGMIKRGKLGFKEENRLTNVNSDYNRSE